MAGTGDSQRQDQFGLRFPLIHASAERAPLAEASFDLAISAYGASIWCDPDAWIPEAARLLRDCGLAVVGILDEALHGTVEVVLPRPVIAQVWRDGPRQSNTGRLISAGRTRGGPVIIDELTADRAEQIGITIGATAHPDIVDVHVALAAAERGHAVLTSDDADIAGVNPALVLVHV